MTKRWHWRYNKVHMATRWTIRHGLMPLWFKDLMNITEKLQFIDPTFRLHHPWCYGNGAEISRYLLNQSLTFSRASNIFHVFYFEFSLAALGFPDWISWLVPCDWFDFGFTTLNWTALQHQSQHDHPHPVSSLTPYDVFLLFVGCFLLIALNRKVL